MLTKLYAWAERALVYTDTMFGPAKKSIRPPWFLRYAHDRVAQFIAQVLPVGSPLPSMVTASHSDGSVWQWMPQPVEAPDEEYARVVSSVMDTKPEAIELPKEFVGEPEPTSYGLRTDSIPFTLPPSIEKFELEALIICQRVHKGIVACTNVHNPHVRQQILRIATANNWNTMEFKVVAKAPIEQP